MDYKIDPATKDNALTDGGDLEMSDDLGNNVYLSLMTEQGSDIDDAAFGSKLHLLTREKAVGNIEAVAREYCVEALAWILKAKRAEKFDIVTELEKGETSSLKLNITAWRNGRPQSYEHFVEVR